MKHRALSILLALTFLLSVFMFCTTAFAATGAQDGVSAELTTDKAEYAAGESMNVTLVVKNGNNRVNNIRTELVLPAGVTLTTGALVSDGVDLAPNAEAAYQYGLTVDVPEVPTTTTPPTTQAPTTVPPTTQAPTTEAPTTEAPTTQAPTTAPGGDDDGPAETKDITLVIYGLLAVASLVAMIVLMGGRNMFKQRWFVIVLCCALLLGIAGPIAVNAATTERTFVVYEDVTIAGASAKLKAIITYDLNDEVLHTEEVAFKKDGQFLWSKEVEMGYWLPSDINYNGQTTSKDGSYRPEVTPPYIDMLFGCTSNQTGQFVSGEFKTDIFNADAEQTVLIGLTDDPASKAALELIDEDEWIITVIDGKLVVTGWYDNATVAATRALYALAASNADNVTLTLPMIGKLNYVDVELPAVPFGNFRGGMDSDQGVVVLRWNEVVADDFDTYCDLLTAAGYEQYEYNTLDGFKKTKKLEFATYVKGDDAVIVQYLPVSLLDEDPATLTSAELKAQQAMFSPDGDSIRLILTSADTLGNNDANNTGWEDLGITPKMHAVNIFNRPADGNAIGQGQLFTLADGSFILVDGGHQTYDAEQVYRAMKYLNERPDGKIVIAAWILTHDHRDHSGAIEEMAAKFASEITVEQIILNNDPDTFMWRHKNAPYGYSYGTYGVFDKIEQVADQFGEDCKVVVAHMGQNMKIRNTEVEILTVGAEDLYPVLTRNDNSRSMAFRVSYPALEDSGKSQSTLILGDVTLDNTYHTFFPLMIDELYGDIVQVAHHGLGGQTSRFYPVFRGVDVALWPTDEKTIEANGLMGGNNSYLQEFDPLNVICDEYIMTFNLPFDKDNDEVMRTKVGTFKTEVEELEMDITLLPAFRFQGQWNAKKDIIVDYLKKYTADVLVLPLIDQNTTTKYNKADLVNELYEELDYQYIYYAPVWGCEADANMESGDGTMGHVILSVYPILKAETGILVEGTPDAKPEGRGYAHVLLDVEGLELDFVATHFNDSGNWAKFAEVYQQWGKCTIIAGNTKIKGDVSKAPIDLQASAFASDVTILATEGVTFEKAATNSDLAAEGSEYFVNKNMGSVYTVKAYIVQTMAAEPMKVTFNANGGTGTMEPITTRRATLPLPECQFGAPEGKRFKGWALSQADADAGNVVRKLILTKDVELYAVWTDLDTILISTAFTQFAETNETARDFFVEYYTRNVFDVIALNNVSPTIDLDKLTADIGFSHYYVAINSKGTERTVLISKFEITNAKSYEFNKLDGNNNATSWDPMVYATMKVGDRYVDICIGQHHSMALRAFAANIVKENYDPTHDLIITGYNSAAAATFFDATGVSLGFIKGSANSLYYSSGLTNLGGGTDADYVPPVSSMWTPSYAEFGFVKTCKVTFNANGGSGGPVAVPSAVPSGEYTPSEHHFVPPVGKTFAGWATTPDGTPSKSVTITEDTTLYAIWESYNYPTYTAPSGADEKNTISAFQLWGVGTNFTSWDQYTAYISQEANHTDISVLIHAVIDPAQIDAIKQAAGYEYSYYVVAEASNNTVHLLFSEYPISGVAAYSLPHQSNWAPAPSTEGRAFAYVSLNVDGTAIDLVMGENNGNSYAGQWHNILLVEPWVEAIADNRNNPLLIAGYKMNRPADTSFNSFTKIGAGNSQYVLSAAITYSNYADLAKLSDNKNASAPAYVELTFATKKASGGESSGLPLKVMSWNTNLFGVSNACADAVVNEIKAQDPDIVGLINVGNQSWRSSKTTYTLEDILNKLDYPYYYYLPLYGDYAFTDGVNFYGNLILSKYPLTDKVTSDYQYLDKSYIGHCVVDLGVTQVDLYITREVNASKLAALHSAIQESNTPGNDFILFAEGNAGSDTMIAGKPVAGATFEATANSGIALFASTVNQTVGPDDVWMVNKPAAIANNTNGNLIISNIAMMNITVRKEYTVSFNANGGTGTMGNATAGDGAYTLPACGFAGPNGAKFMGWALTKDGEVLTSLELTGDVTLYARWEATDLKMMSWNVNLMGVHDDCVSIILAEVKAQDPDIVALLNIGNQAWGSNGKNTSTLDGVLEALGYPHYYYIPLSAAHDFAGNDYYGHLIVSKYPLEAKVTTATNPVPSHAGGGYIGHCVADLGCTKLDLFTSYDMKAANRPAVVSYVTANAATTNDFVIFVSGAVGAGFDKYGDRTATVYADGTSASITYTSAYMSVEKSEIIAKPTTLAGYKGNALIGNEVVVNVSFFKEYTVSFDANGGTGTMDAVTAEAGAFTLPECTFTAPEGKRFLGWSLTADGEVLTSLVVTGDVKLYARWGAATLKIMSWNVNLMGVSNDCADIILGEVKAENPDIVGLLNVGNSAWGGGQITYTLEEIVAKSGYPYFYASPIAAGYGAESNNFYVNLILSKYPLSDKLSEGFTELATSSKGYIGHCVADLGSFKLDLYTAYNVAGSANGAGLFDFVEANTAAGNEFVIFAHGNVVNTDTVAGKPVANNTNAKNIAVISSLGKMTATGSSIKTKPSALGAYKGNALIGDEAIMTLKID